METNYIRDYSPIMGVEMEMKVYGHAGHPVLFIPCQDGRFFDFENFKMADRWSPWIENGECMVFSIDTIDLETWSKKDGDPYWRIRRYEQWIDYICNEVVPFIQAYAREKNGWDGNPGVYTFGCSLGATHAANLFFRRPDLFDGCLALSGIYSASYGFDGYMDEVVYRNSVVDYLAGMSDGHPWIEQINRGRGIICVGTGAWEIPDTTLQIKAICERKGMNVWVDVWGSDVNHDWDWWYKQVDYFVPRLLHG